MLIMDQNKLFDDTFHFNVQDSFSVTLNNKNIKKDIQERHHQERHGAPGKSPAEGYEDD